MATAPGHGAGHPSVPCPQLPPAPPVPSVVALTLPPDPAFPQPESKNLRIILQSIRGQATVLEVQRWGCASLRDLAQESAEDRSWLGRLGGIELVLDAMRTFQSDTELQQCACGALATLSYENQANTSGVLQHGGVELLLRAMHAHSSSSAVQGLACYVLRILAVLEEGREHMVQLGGIETIFVALRNHIEDVELQGSGCGVLGRLTACSSEDLATVSSADGLGVALRALASHPDDSQVQACASALLGNLVLAGSNSVQDIAGSGKAAQLLVHALGHQSSEAQSCAISALNNMCLRSEDCVAQAAVNGAYAPLATTFQHQDERGQLFAITVLYLLAMQDKGDMMDFVRLQGLSHLIPIMMHLMSSLKVQEQISSILQRFGSRSEILDEILYQGGLAAILTAMHRFPMSPRIQVSGCFLTAHWARSGPDEAQRVAEAGGVELVAAAMQKHLAQVDVQVFGCMMLQAVADQVAESPQAVAHFGGVEAVLQSLKRHREDGRLQEMAVQALCSLGRQDQICRIKVVEYGLPKDPSKALSSKEEPVLFVPDDGLRGKKVELWTLWGRSIPQHEEEIASSDERNDEMLLDAPPEVTEEPAVRGVQLLFRALLHPHGEVASVLHSATCSLLAHIAGDGKEYQAHVLEEGGIVAATRSAHMHASDPQVQVDAFHLLLNLVSEGPSDLVQMATAYGAVELIMQALRTYPELKAVLRASAKLIRSLILGGDRSASESTLSRNFEDRITNFDGFAEGLRVDTFLQELRRYSADVATRCTAQGLVEIFMKSLATFAADTEMKEVILVAYRELAANRRSRHRMTMRGTWKEIMAEVKAHQDHPTLQVFGCDLMELQTRDCEHANIEDAIVFGGIESLLKVFKNHAQNLTVQERSCVAAAKLASRSPDIKAMFIEGHLIQMIVDIMAWHRGSENLQKVACVVLLSLADHSLQCRSEMVSSNCLEAACAALQEHPVGVTDLQAQALMLMASLGGDGAEVRSRLADADGLLLSLHAMEASIESFEAQMEGCHLLASWGRDDPQYFQLILDSDRLVSIIRGMQRHVKQRRVQEEFAELLRCLAMHSQDGKDKVIAAGGIEAMLDGMNANRKSDELAYRGCASMAILAKGNQTAVARIAKHDGAKHIVRAMLVERERADLQESALEAIRAISADDEEVPAQIASNGGVQFVVQALTDFKDYEAIQEHGLAALANLAWDSADNQLQIGELEGCEHAIQVLALHSENSKVQAFGCALLQSVACNNPEMRTRIGEIGGVEAIVQAMQRDLKAANVQAFGASALQSLAMHNQDNVRRCHKLKVVDFVADAMEAHPYSLKLREFGEMLINTIEG
mgnify:FL=1